MVISPFSLVFLQKKKINYLLPKSWDPLSPNNRYRYINKGNGHFYTANFRERESEGERILRENGKRTISCFSQDQSQRQQKETKEGFIHKNWFSHTLGQVFFPFTLFNFLCAFSAIIFVFYLFNFFCPNLLLLSSFFNHTYINGAGMMRN